MPSKLPPFDPDAPELWFAVVECILHCANVTSDTDRFTYVVSELDETIVTQMCDVLLETSGSSYEKLKSAMIGRLATPTPVRAAKMAAAEMGEQTPSQFLRRLQRIAGRAFGEDEVRAAWMARLPYDVKATIILHGDPSLEKQAELADRVYELMVSRWTAARM